jgi:hypothetical protein
MRRRSLLTTLGALAAGCTGITPESTPTRSPHREYRITGFSVTTSDETSKYALRKTALYSTEGIEEKRAESDTEIVVRNVSEIEPANVRQAIKTAIRQEEWGADTLPEELADTVHRVDFFTGVPNESPYTHFGVKLFVRPAHIEFDASLIDRHVSQGDRGVVEFSLTNTGKETVTVESGTIVPFGTLKAKRHEKDEAFLLWHDYERYDCVEVSSDGVLSCLIALQTPMEPGETLSRKYELHPSTTTLYPDLTAPPGPGKYRVSGTIEFGREQTASFPAPGSPLEYEIDFTLEPS